MEGGTLEEAATPRIANLGNADIVALIDLILGEESILDVSEKLSRSEFVCDHRQTGDSLHQIQAATRLFREAREPFRSIFAAHEGDGEYVFEMISPDERPDYVNYLTDNTIFVDFSGRLTPENGKINVERSTYTFMTKEPNPPQSVRFNRRSTSRVSRFAFESRRKTQKTQTNKRLPSESRQSSSLQTSKVFWEEELKVSTSLAERKISRFPSPTYQNLQKLQAGIYAVLSGRAGIRKAVVKQRVIDGEDSDKIVQDLRKIPIICPKRHPCGL